MVPQTVFYRDRLRMIARGERSAGKQTRDHSIAYFLGLAVAEGICGVRLAGIRT